MRPVTLNGSSDGADFDRSRLPFDERIALAWQQSAIDRIDVIAKDAGSWTTTTACPTPRLWLLLTGHYRTFSYTLPNIQRMAHASSHGCYMAAAVMPDEICVRRGGWEKGSSAAANETRCDPAKWYNAEHRALEWRRFAPSIDSVPSLLSKAQAAFKGRLAYAVIRRSGSMHSYGGAFAVFWHMAWAVAQFAAKTHGITPHPSAVVIRTRPDCIFTRPFELTALLNYFEHSAHGAHLLLSQETIPTPLSPNAQGDNLMITSWRCYTNDIAVPLGLQSRRDIGVRRGWGVLATLQVQTTPVCECLSEASLAFPRGRIEPASACPTPSCDVIAAESPFIVSNDPSGLMRFAPVRPTPFDVRRRIDLATGVHCYCPSGIAEPLLADFTIATPRLQPLSKPWLVQQGESYYRCLDAANLTVTSEGSSGSGRSSVWCMPHPALPMLERPTRGAIPATSTQLDSADSRHGDAAAMTSGWRHATGHGGGHGRREAPTVAQCFKAFAKGTLVIASGLERDDEPCPDPTGLETVDDQLRAVSAGCLFAPIPSDTSAAAVRHCLRCCVNYWAARAAKPGVDIVDPPSVWPVTATWWVGGGNRAHSRAAESPRVSLFDWLPRMRNVTVVAADSWPREAVRRMARALGAARHHPVFVSAPAHAPSRAHAHAHAPSRLCESSRTYENALPAVCSRPQTCVPAAHPLVHPMYSFG